MSIHTPDTLETAVLRDDPRGGPFRLKQAYCHLLNLVKAYVDARAPEGAVAAIVHAEGGIATTGGGATEVWQVPGVQLGDLASVTVTERLNASVVEVRTVTVTDVDEVTVTFSADPDVDLTCQLIVVRST